MNKYPVPCVGVGVEDLLQLLEPLVEIFGEVLLGEGLLRIFFELAADPLRELIQAWTIGPAVSSIGLLLVGSAAGLLSAFVVPHRLIATSAVFPGLSLLLAPLVAASAMYFSGNRLRRFGWRPTKLAGLCGGALVAFSMALMRWWLVGLHH